MRLAEAAGELDVDAYMDTISPEQFDKWLAKDLVEPIGHGQRMLGFIAYMLASALSEDGAQIEAEAFMPWIRYEPKPKPKNKAAQQLLTSIFGKPRRRPNG